MPATNINVRFTGCCFEALRLMSLKENEGLCMIAAGGEPSGRSQANNP